MLASFSTGGTPSISWCCWLSELIRKQYGELDIEWPFSCISCTEAMWERKKKVVSQSARATNFLNNDDKQHLKRHQPGLHVPHTRTYLVLELCKTFKAALVAHETDRSDYCNDRDDKKLHGDKTRLMWASQSATTLLGVPVPLSIQRGQPAFARICLPQ